ncbi:trehalose-phosphatase [Psychroflexus maritimus]|uniref:trehalose-phosphatase n=1 Tax=Psychroflexus maritimus TaxID=2714865 RepID=UPI00293B9547|nr:trehalose-phosphatase [Psychroflexus maritimus]
MDLVSDHGVYYKPKLGKWKMTENLKTEWIPSVLSVFEKFVDRTPGSSIEKKKFYLAWYHPIVDKELARKSLTEIKTVLNSFIANTDLTMLDGNKVLEVKSTKVSKGRASTQIQKQVNFDEILCFGDDWTDEFMFEDLPEKIHSIRVGFKKNKRKAQCSFALRVRRILQYLL